MATIKAGTYRFNDVLTVPSGAIEQSLNYELPCLVSVNGVVADFNATCSMIVPYSEDINEATTTYLYFVLETISVDGEMVDGHITEFEAYVSTEGWKSVINAMYGFDEELAELLTDWGRTITIPTDSEVSAEFAEWFSANAAPVVEHTVSGVWKFKDVLTIPMADFDFDEQIDFSVAVDYMGEKVSASCDGIQFATVGHDDDWRLIYNCITPPFDYEVYVYWNTSHRWEDMFGEGIKTIDFGNEPQTVSAEFYEWLAENATQPCASITHNGEVIASLFAGQTATLKCAGMKMAGDVVVSVAAPKAPGLYKTGTDILITNWDSLVSSGVINIDNGVVYTNADLNSMTNGSSDYLAGDLVIPDDGSITALGDFRLFSESGRVAFGGCTGLTGVEIPDSVVYISSLAFALCINLKYINIPNNLKADGMCILAGCSSIERINVDNIKIWYTCGGYLPDIVGIIDSSPGSLSQLVYINGIKVSSFDITENIESIGACVLAGASNLTTININAELDTLYSLRDAEFIKVVDNLDIMTIGHSAFRECLNLESVDIVKYGPVIIGSDAFYGTEKLDHINITAPALSINASSISGTPAKKITLDCEELLLSGSGDVFNSLSGITSLGHTDQFDMKVPENITYYNQSGEFYNGFFSCENLKKVKLNWGGIGYGGDFDRCDSITSVGPGDGYDFVLGSLPYAGLRECKGLIVVVIPKGGIYSEGCFDNCENLCSVYIPDDIQGLSGFMNCDNLTDVYYMGTEYDDFSWIPRDAFSHLSNVAIHYQMTCLNIDGVVYPSDINMTLEQWFNSDYNTLGIGTKIVDGYIYDSTDTKVLCSIPDTLSSKVKASEQFSHGKCFFWSML